jgi:replicative DNA helicase
MLIPEKLSSFESEQIWLGTVIAHSRGELITDCGICSEHFHSQVNRMIFTACSRIHAKRLTVDASIVANELREMECLDYVGGFQYVIEICKITSLSNIKHYADTIKRKYRERTAWSVMRDGLEAAAAGELDVDSIISSLMATISTESNYEYDSIGVAGAAIDELEKALKQEFPGVPFGIKSMDDATGGAHNSDLVVIAAKPAMGKTALLLNVMINAMTSGNNVGFISAEMPVGQIGMRIACTNGSVEAHKARKGDLDDTGYSNFSRGLSLLHSVNLQVYEKSAPTIAEVERMAKKWKHHSGIRALYVDYIQRIKGSNPASQRWEQVGEVVMRLKDLARELDIPVICLAQVNRGVDTRGEKRPELGDIANSAEIEKEADQIMTLYRDEVYHDDTPDRGIAEVDFKKNRHGPTGMIRLQWKAPFMKFCDLSEKY